MLRHGRRLVSRVAPVRSYTTIGRSNPPIRLNQTTTPKRLGTVSILHPYSTAATASQSAHNPNAYIDSGVIKPQQTVDVKKVLVIGSGGLAIGQAGEFDYSGWLLYLLPSMATKCSHTAHDLD